MEILRKESCDIFEFEYLTESLLKHVPRNNISYVKGDVIATYFLLPSHPLQQDYLKTIFVTHHLS